MRTGDQRLDLARHPSVAGQGSAPPLLAATVCRGHARPRHGDLNRAEAAQQLPLSRPVPVALQLAYGPLGPAAPKRRRQSLLQQLLDEIADATPKTGLNRVESGISCKQPRAVRFPCRATLFQGAVSTGAPTPGWLIATNRRLRH